MSCIVFCTIMISLSLSSCIFLNYKYRGNTPELYTVAVNNIFGSSGYTNNGEISYTPEISAIETDNYGRTLFFYNENYGQGNWYGMAFVVMQKSENGYVYYYQDDCYLPFFDATDYFWHGRIGGEDYIKAVELAGESIEALKKRNDWNEEFDKTKCTKSKISDIKPDGKIDVVTWTFDDEIYAYAKANGYQGFDDNAVKFFIYCNADASGKELYYVYCMSADDDEKGETIYNTYVYAVIVDTDKSIFKNPVITENAIVEIKDPTIHYDLITKLKEKNDWE